MSFTSRVAELKLVVLLVVSDQQLWPSGDPSVRAFVDPENGDSSPLTDLSRSNCTRTIYDRTDGIPSSGRGASPVSMEDRAKGWALDKVRKV